MFDVGGNIILDLVNDVLCKGNFVDCRYFMIYCDNLNVGFYVSDLFVLCLCVGMLSIVLLWCILNLDGLFVGIVLIVINFEYFYKLFVGLLLG